MLLLVLQPQIDQPPNGFGPRRKVLLRPSPIIDVLPEAGRSHQLDTLVELFLVAQSGLLAVFPGISGLF
jgi:hypothetical protein